MSGYIGPAPVPQATQTREAFTATSGQTTFNTGGYTAGYIDVFLNGVKLAAADYTATNGSDVVLATGAATGDILETVAYTAFTVADQTFTGDIVMSDGLTIDNDGATVLTVDRATSDGAIIDVQKDGSTVGSIGVDSGGFYIDGEANHTGVRFKGGAFTPRLNGTQANGTVSLGNATERYQDLYLSGGVYLGGTGSANQLTDYETGTWTPVYSGSTTDPTITYDTQVGLYVKIGRFVHLQGRIRTDALSGGSGFIDITGLPFSNVNVTGAYAGINIVYSSGWTAGKAPNGGYINANTSNIRLIRSASADARDNRNVSPQVSDMGTGINQSDILFTASYYSN